MRLSDGRTLSRRYVRSLFSRLHCDFKARSETEIPRLFQDPEAAKKLNIAVPAHLSTLSRSSAHPFTLIYISTDYVFDGHAPPTGYEPDAKTGPTNAYGDSKLAGEEVVLGGLKNGGKGCILRIPVL